MTDPLSTGSSDGKPERTKASPSSEPKTIEDETAGEPIDPQLQELLDFNPRPLGAGTWRMRSNHEPVPFSTLGKDRIDTAIAYITDPASPTTKDIAERFGYPLKHIRKWALEDSWGPRRIQFLNKVYTDLRDRLADTLTTDRLESLEYARKLRVRAFGLLNSDVFTVLTSARAYAALLRAFVDLSKYVDHLGVDAAERIVSGPSRSQSDNAAKLPEGVTEEMLEAMNKAFIDAHQARISAGAAGNSTSTIIDVDTGQVVDEKDDCEDHDEEGDGA